MKHETKQEAQRHLERLWRLDNDHMHTYQCKLCGAFHVGHKTRY